MSIRPEGAIAVNPAVARLVATRRQLVGIADTDFTDVSAVVLAPGDLEDGVAERLRANGFDLPVFVVSGPDDSVDLTAHRIAGVLSREGQNAEFFGRMVETAALEYDETVLPPFFDALARYERRGRSGPTSATPMSPWAI